MTTELTEGQAIMTNDFVRPLPVAKKMMFAAVALGILALPVTIGLVGNAAHATEGHVQIDTSKFCKPPVYPVEALEANQTGTVQMSLEVDDQGKVIDSKILQSSGFPSLDKAAVDALALCAYVPAQIDGKAATVWARFKYTWASN